LKCNNDDSERTSGGRRSTIYVTRAAWHIGWMVAMNSLSLPGNAGLTAAQRLALLRDASLIGGGDKTPTRSSLAAHSRVVVIVRTFVSTLDGA
jgi:hypothetical protein